MHFHKQLQAEQILLLANMLVGGISVYGISKKIIVNMIKNHHLKKSGDKNNAQIHKYKIL